MEQDREAVQAEAWVKVEVKAEVEKAWHELEKRMRDSYDDFRGYGRIQGYLTLLAEEEQALQDLEDKEKYVEREKKEVKA